MKLKSLLWLGLCAFLLSSCFSHHYNIGNGVRVEKTREITKKNHFLMMGVIPVKRCKVDEMVGDTINYHVYTRATPTDMVVSTLTIGIYTPTTTTVTMPNEKYRRKTNRKVKRKD
ncbi:MAG: Bor family protein [Bacteroidetes bacterium]|nr:Bor family protein [Bacteroidota bacterium]